MRLPPVVSALQQIIKKSPVHISFSSGSRVMMFAPHPDDESLAAGVFLQKAVSAGAAVRVVYATDGDDNPWPQRATERKWRLAPRDRARWGKRRRREAIAALETLGLRAADARFLGLPDQGLTDLLLREADKVCQRLRDVIRTWAPTHLVLPAMCDTHPDHSALSVLLQLALDDEQWPTHRPVELAYLVHGHRAAFAHVAREYSQTGRAEEAKRRAICCHRSQIKFSRKRFLAYAARPEIFQTGPPKSDRVMSRIIRSVIRTTDRLTVTVALRLRPLRLSESQVYVVGHAESGATMLSVRARLPAGDARVQLTNCLTARRTGIGIYRGNVFAGKIVLPISQFASGKPLFVKVCRRSWFFDEAGWIKIPASVSPIAPSWARREKVAAAVASAVTSA